MVQIFRVGLQVKWDLCVQFLEFLWCDFFFSSRRRHTRFKCDWSSDVCSSDLLPAQAALLDGSVSRCSRPRALRSMLYLPAARFRFCLTSAGTVLTCWTRARRKQSLDRKSVV